MVTAAPNYAGFKRLIGDESNHTHGIVVNDTSRAMHFIRASQVGNDWGVAADTHPTLYVHSNTTPTTDYGLIRHNATNLEIESVGGGIILTAVTDVIIPANTGLLMGHTVAITAGGATPAIQILGDGDGDTRLLILAYRTSNTLAVAPRISLVKSTTATIGGTTDALVADNEVLGAISFYGSDAVDLDTEAAALFVEVDDGSPAAGDIGTAFVFQQMPGGAGSLTETLRISAAGIVHVNDSANGSMTIGVTINQGASDNEIFAVKSSDTAHGVTAITETDTYFAIRKESGNLAGVRMICMGEGGATEGLSIRAISGTDNTTKGTTARATVIINVSDINGIGTQARGADANLVAISSDTTVRFIWDVEGSAHADVEWVAFDDYDDLALMEDMQAFLTDSKQDVVYQLEALADMKVVGRNSLHWEDGKLRAMVNFNRLAMVHHGAIGQLWKRVEGELVSLREEAKELRALVAGGA